MAENQLPVLSHEIPMPREPLTEERVDKLLAAFGNHGGKAALLLAMKPRESYYGAELHGLVDELSGDEAVYIGTGDNQINYCAQSFGPIGKVTEAQLQPDGTVKHTITDEGERYGKPLAAALLDISDRYDATLSNVFGSTSSRGVRSPYIRYQLAKELAKQEGEQTAQALAQATGLSPRAVTRHLDSLALDGLVGFKQFDRARDRIRYEFIEKPEGLTARTSQGVRDALAYLEEHGTATLDDVAQHCWEKLTVAEQQATTPAVARNRLNVHLISLEKRKGCIKKTGRQAEEFSNVSLDDTQKAFWGELAGTLEAFRSGDPGAYRSFANIQKDLLNDKPKMARILKQAYELSPLADTGSLKDVGSLAVRAMEAAGQAISVNEIVRIIKADTGRQVNRMTVQAGLLRFEAVGKVIVGAGKTRRFSLAGNPEVDNRGEA